MRPLLVLATVAVACLASVPASAQEYARYQGEWKIEFINKQGVRQTGTATIKDKSGEWDMVATSKGKGKNPCVGLPVPLEVKKATQDELVLVLYRSEALRGCTDSKVIFKRVDENTLDGAFKNGSKVKLLR